MANQKGIVTWLVVAFVIVTYLVVESIYCYNLSGFRLYLIGLSIRCITILVGISIATTAQWSKWQVGGGLAFGTILIGFWVASHIEQKQIDRVRKTSSAQWNLWADKAKHLKQSSLLNRLLLPKVERVVS